MTDPKIHKRIWKDGCELWLECDESNAVDCWLAAADIWRSLPKVTAIGPCSIKIMEECPAE